MNFEHIQTLREINPLVHNITNLVVANDSANGLLAIGASPFMSNTVMEVAEIQTFNHALVLNMGTINDEQLEAMLLAGQAANQQGKPVVIDPVGAGATTYRKEVIQQLLEKIQPTLIRGNAGELASLANVPWEAKGVDAGSGRANVQDIAETVAKKYHCIVFISGETDVITNGEQTYLNKNGTPDFTQMTGSGCLLSCICGAFLGSLTTNKPAEQLEAVVLAGITYSIAGEMAVEGFEELQVGRFRMNLLDQLSTINGASVAAKVKGEWVKKHE